MAKLAVDGHYAPTTVNSWINILRVIMKAAKRKYRLAHDPVDGVRLLDTSEHATYTEEEPNSLLPEEVGPFVARFRELYPQHFGMLLLMLVTGLRPSSVRPLRRSGPESDVDWDRGRLLVRRSYTLGPDVMKTTKQKRRYAIVLPDEVVAVLRWHVDTQLETPEQQESALLFPSIVGGFRTQKVLNQPIAEVTADLGIMKRLTQCGLRRTYNDLMRAAQVNDLVVRSISGHLTPAMQGHYSTVNGGEQREALAKVYRMLDFRKAAESQGQAQGPAPEPGGQIGGQITTGGGQKSQTG